MSESLSRQERELLSTPIRDETPTAPLNIFAGNREDDDFGSEITDEQLDAVESFHQSVAKRFSIALSDLLQQVVDVRLRTARVDTYSKFIFSRATPTCLVTLKAHPLRESLGIDYSPTILYPLFDCLLGGGHQAVEIPTRPMTQIEQRLATRITTTLLAELHDAWEHVLAVDLAIELVESNAQRVRLIAPSDKTITLTFQTTVAEQSGEITICLPLRAVHKMIARLCGPAEPKSMADDSDVSAISVTLGPVTIKSSDYSKLQPGELLITDLSAGTTASVLINGIRCFQARPASLQGHKAVIIEGDACE